MGGLTSTPGFTTVGGKPQNKNAVGKLSEVPVKYFLFIKPTYRSFATTVSQLKISDFSGKYSIWF
jgi:hypothetical protein